MFNAKKLVDINKIIFQWHSYNMNVIVISVQIYMCTKDRKTYATISSIICYMQPWSSGVYFH